MKKKTEFVGTASMVQSFTSETGEPCVNAAATILAGGEVNVTFGYNLRFVTLPELALQLGRIVCELPVANKQN